MVTQISVLDVVRAEGDGIVSAVEYLYLYVLMFNSFTSASTLDFSKVSRTFCSV